jgi:hypothetical protein
MEKVALEKLRSYAASSRSQATFGGSTFLKLDQNDGNWKAGKSNINMNDRKLGADLPDAMGGFQRLESGQKPIYAVVRILDDVAQPERSKLGELDEFKWIDKKDPYQPVIIVPFWDFETRQIFIYPAANSGARDAVAGLLDAYADNCANHPEDAHKLPIIELKSDSYVNTNGKTIFVPLLDIVGWTERPVAVRHVQPPPLSIEIAPKLAADAPAESTKPATADQRAAAAKAKPKKPTKLDMNDEIPF